MVCGRRLTAGGLLAAALLALVAPPVSGLFGAGLAIAGGLGGLLGLKLIALKAGAIGGYIGAHYGGRRHHYAPRFRFRGYKSHHGYHRRRRSAEGPTQVAAPSFSEEEYFALVAVTDLSGCGQKLVCELAAADPATLADDEALILALFGPGAPPEPNSLFNSAKAQYEMAAFLGRTGRQAACTALYTGRCPHSGSELMAALRAADSL